MTWLCIKCGQTPETKDCPNCGVHEEFEVLQTNPKTCSVCGDDFFAMDETRTTCAHKDCN